MAWTNKVALVTGAGRGIGRAVALALAQQGCDVVVNDLAADGGAAEVVTEIEALGRRAWLGIADVADAAAVEQLVGEAVERLGRLDIAVANAAFSHRQFFVEADMELFRRTIDVTMWGPLHLTREAARAMVRQGQGGAIVVISSPHAVVAVPMSMAYNMAKAAIDHMMRTAAVELLDHRIRVNAIHPGWIDTPGERRFFSEDDIQRAAQSLPWKRLGRPDEIARGVVFLCDPASDYITGSVLAIDGGIQLPYWARGGSAVPGSEKP